MHRESSTTDLSIYNEPPPVRPLDGVRVLDLTRYLPGPFCSRLLADMGAEIIKIEEPASGDPTRRMPPFIGRHSAVFALLNHSKKGLALNLKDATGREIFEQLVAVSEVVLEGHRPGVAERLGVGYERLSRIRPDLVYCSLTGYGQKGADAGRAGHDLNYMARSGILSLMTDAAGAPVIPGIQVADLVGGIYATTSILAALRLRDQAGQGQYCDLSMLNGLLSLLATPVALALGNVPTGPGARLPLSGKAACYNVYRTADGRFVSLAALEPKFWDRFCRLAQRPEWIGRQYDEYGQSELKEEVSALFATRTMAEWLQFSAGEDVCLEPVLTLEEVLHSLPAFAGRATDSSNVPASAASFIRFPVDWPATETAQCVEAEGVTCHQVPGLGEHNASVLALLGYSQQEINDFRLRGIISP